MIFVAVENINFLCLFKFIYIEQVRVLFRMTKYKNTYHEYKAWNVMFLFHFRWQTRWYNCCHSQSHELCWVYIVRTLAWSSSECASVCVCVCVCVCAVSEIHWLLILMKNCLCQRIAMVVTRKIQCNWTINKSRNIMDFY